MRTKARRGAFSTSLIQRVAVGVSFAGLAAAVAMGLGLPVARPVSLDAAEPTISYSRDVRPILAEYCFQCHGPDEGKREAKLRLDLRDAAMAPAESGAKAIVPSQPDASELVKRITAADASVRMPPADLGKKPSAAQIETLKKWIAEGASYQGHWAFQPPSKPEPPRVKREDWVRTPVDRFIALGHERERLEPSPVADRITLLRRLHLDLIGLPPTIAEVDAFVDDKAPDAYENAVERLLKSPHYGERWGRHWLDVARYADSDGFEKDKSRQVHFYRDYVIQTLNRDVPYDRFVIEQLAGDLLPGATQDQIVATGFLRNSMINEEGGVDPEQFRMDAMFDRMEAIGKGILGLTIQCSQCHSHKYDPLTQEEYYRMFAFLNNDHEAQRVVYSPAEQMQIADVVRQMREVEARLRETTPDWAERMAKWEEEQSRGKLEWTTLEIENAGDNGQRYIPQGDGSLLAQGYAPTKFTAQFRAKTKLKGITAFRLELLNDPNLPCMGPGRSFKGTCALSEFSVESATAAEPAKKSKQKIAAASADYTQPERELESNFFDKSTDRRVTGPVSMAIDGDGKTAWGIDAGPGRRNQPRHAVFRLEKPIDGGADDVVLLFSLMQNHGGWNSDDHMNNNLGRFRISATTAPEAAADSVPPRIRRILDTPRSQRSEPQTAELFSHWRTTVNDWREANERIEKLWQRWPAGATALTLLARDSSRDTKILNRGNWLKPTASVKPGVPSFLNPLVEQGDSSRLTFARWIVDRRAPTTARVLVNRVWQTYFGQGLVTTPEDFGVKGEPPTHPELLDWLATDFMDSGWSLKHLHKRIVLSSTYRQTSRATAELLQRDPFNRWLARGSRVRVEGEIVRDITLASSGLLNPAIGGRSVMPPAPEFLFQPPASYAPFPWVSETGPDKYRRAVYTFRRRSTPYPMLQTFDVPNADTSCVRRLRSNSPLQALVSLNEPLFVEAAQALARRTLSDGGATDADRLRYAFRRVLARVPQPEELGELSQLLGKQQRRIADGWLNAAEIATGENKPPADLPKGATPAQLAAYTIVCRAILNLDEAITRE